MSDLPQIQESEVLQASDMEISSPQIGTHGEHGEMQVVK